VHLDGACEVEIAYADLEQAVESAVAALEAEPSIFVAVAHIEDGIVCSLGELRKFSQRRSRLLSTNISASA
jgi:hypothetical protein